MTDLERFAERMDLPPGGYEVREASEEDMRRAGISEAHLAEILQARRLRARVASYAEAVEIVRAHLPSCQGNFVVYPDDGLEDADAYLISIGHPDPDVPPYPGVWTHLVEKRSGAVIHVNPLPDDADWKRLERMTPVRA